MHSLLFVLINVSAFVCILWCAAILIYTITIHCKLPCCDLKCCLCILNLSLLPSSYSKYCGILFARKDKATGFCRLYNLLNLEQ